MLSKDFIADRDAVGRGFMTELYQVLDKQDMDATQRAELEDTRRQIALNTSQAYLGVTSGAAQVKALAQAQVSSQTSLASSKLGLEVGVRTTLDVLNAQQQLYATERDLAAARYAYLLSGLRLKAAAGSLTEADLATIDQLLIPAR